MKKTTALVLFLLLLNLSNSYAADSTRHFEGYGEVLSVDPISSQITIQHRAIKGLEGSGDTQFYVSDAAMLKGIEKHDLVEFDLVEIKGDLKIEKLEKTGVALPREEGIPLGQAVHDTIQGTGQVLKTVTSPLPAVSDAVGGASDSAASAADPRIQDGEVKQKIATF